jgi:diguanylate cyclase (GGDEF)-like protein
MPLMDVSQISFEKQTHHNLRLMAALSQVVATLTCLVALVLMQVYRGISPWMYVWVLVSALGTVVMYRSRDLRTLWLASVAAMLGCVSCFAHLANLMENPVFWFLPIGLGITLPSAAMYHYTRDFAITSILVWGVSALVIQPHFALELEFFVVWMTVLSTISAGSLVSLAFQRTRRANFNLQQKLHAIAHVDALTGLPNRRAFMDGLAHAAQPPNESLYFFMLDIDDFKKINDSFGHDVGDLALIEVAKVLTAKASHHVFGRLGGEEFAVVAAVGEAEAHALAHSMVDAVHACSVRDRRMSISIGVALWQPAESAASLMRRADEALYQAKHAGKNRYVLAS